MAFIKGNGNKNTLVGTRKADKILGLGENDKLLGGRGSDKLYGGEGDDRIKGGDGDDFIVAASGADVVEGGKGDNVFGARADLSVDKYLGGAGVDTVNFAKSTIRVGVDLTEGVGDGAAQGDRFKGIENVEGTRFYNSLTGDGKANKLKGGGGFDELAGRGGNDRLYGGGGNDTIEGGTGKDQLFGGDGFDTLYYGKEASGAVINLASNKGGGSAAGDLWSGFEFIIGTKFGDVITGSAAAETIDGFLGDDALDGGAGDDVLDGGDGSDDLYGDDGHDRLKPGSGDTKADHFHGGDGSDWADYSDEFAAITVLLSHNHAAQAAVGDTFEGVENVEGSRLGDFLAPGTNGRAYGGWGDDTIVDAKGTEVLRGGRGADTLTDNFLGSGEDGKKDIFFLELDLGRDEVFGFTPLTDLMWLSKSQFGGLKTNANFFLLDGQIVNNDDPEATIAGAQLLFDTDDKILSYDADGTGGGAAVEIAKIGNLDSVTTAHFQMVVEA